MESNAVFQNIGKSVTVSPNEIFYDLVTP